MRLVFLGLSITSAWGNGHATTYRGLCRALAARGHDVVFYEWDAPWYAGKHRDLPPSACDYADVRLFKQWSVARRELRRELLDADAVLLGSYFRPGIDAADFLAQEFDGPRLFYDIDTPITLRAYRDRGAAEYLRADQVPIFDVYFSFTGGPVLRELETRYGAPRARPLYCAVDPERHARTPGRRAYRCALGYMGTYAPDRQPTLERLLLEPARRRPGQDFVVAGPLYPADLAWPDNVRRFEHVPPADHPAFYSSNRLTLNVTREEMRRWGWSPSVRIFEAAACGAAIVSDAWEGLDQFLEPAVEVLLPRSAEDVVAYLELSDGEVRAVGEAARERILKSHTNDARAGALEGELDRLLQRA
ncbi:MAG TPA: glycosyltransferase [Longimicrobiales bacterium]|nr:glycosyltransferase [Longimicrobiales bacterium]